MIERVAVATIGHDPYYTSLVSTKHHLLADEPLENGGQDLAPAPTDFLRMSFASCTAITLRMFANRKAFNVDEIKVSVSSEQREGKTFFHRTVEISGSLTDEQRKRMLQVANACPIHKILTNPIEVDTILSVK